MDNDVDIVVTGRHTQITERFRTHLEEKLSKVPHLLPRVSRIDVVVTHEKAVRNCDAVEITCYAKGPVIRAEACTDDLYASLDIALDKLFERLRRVLRPPPGLPNAAGACRSPSRGPPAGSPRAVPTRPQPPRVREDAPADASRQRRLRCHRRLAYRGPREGPRQCADDARGRAQPDGARRPRLLPLPRLRHRPAERRLPPAGLVLRRDPPQGRRLRGTDAPSTGRCRAASTGRRSASVGSATGWPEPRTTACNDARHGRFR